MAKNESSIMAGLSFGSSAPAVQKPAVEEKPVEPAKTETPGKPAAKPASKAKTAKKEEPTPEIIESSYAASRKARERTTRCVRTTISLTPKVHQRVTLATERGEIKSANDLINYLLEDYFKMSAD